MTPKSKTNKWADIQLTIAAIAITSVLALWNMFAGPDKEKAAEKAAEMATQIPTITVAPAIAATMPPLGSTTLLGGEAPKPQVIVVQNQGGGGGGGSVTSTSSS